MIVNSSLDREVADKITLVLTVEDLNAVNGSMQTATGKLYYLIDVDTFYILHFYLQQCFHFIFLPF